MEGIMVSIIDIILEVKSEIVAITDYETTT